MTHSDAPNEGREEKTAEEVYKESWSLLVNGEIDSPAILHAMKVYADQQTKSLRNQLSKEREKVERLEQWKKEEMGVWGPVLDYMQDGGSGKRGPIGASISELVLQILKHHYEGKEREMRKELVKDLESLERLFYAGYTIYPGDLNKLIKKASELDKNK